MKVQDHSYYTPSISSMKENPDQCQEVSIQKKMTLKNLSEHMLNTWFLFFDFLNIFIVVQLQLSPFPPIALPCPIQPLIPKTNPTPLSLSIGLLYMFPFFPPLSPSPLPSGHCKFVLYFYVSGSFLLICLFLKWWQTPLNKPKLDPNKNFHCTFYFDIIVHRCNCKM